ncbi:phosphoenolpyruvate carboxykinase [Fodinicurvata sp. EGI_FJ10296]|uniref:phosphoenolpyruvate carboxykinase n=1 Tax=Fodinicurvata sp. EGI_FJ10296 TaxID=3231908 RepID=UPI003452137D
MTEQSPTLDIQTAVGDAARVHRNASSAALFQDAVERGEGLISADGALAVHTGRHTGRSASDKYIVRDARTEDTVWWDNNQPMSPETFSGLLDTFCAHIKKAERLWVQDLDAGANATHRIRVRLVTEHAWQALFARHLLIEPAESEVGASAGGDSAEPDFTILQMPELTVDPAAHGLKSETVIAVDFTRRIVLIGGTSYAGEMKKSVFTILNYLLPEKGVMPMHCSANVDDDGKSAIFFGLSGTGKTTLSADASRHLVGDDEHGWHDGGIFNFEGGCYAKVIRLSAEAEPEIAAATRSFGTVLENVVVDPVSRRLDLDSDRYTENTRAAYPLSAIPNVLPGGEASHPSAIIMLTADAFGVMPPIARLSVHQAIYHFLSGYTAKLAGTEKGLGKEPEATFSTCFGGPFMPRHAAEYGRLLAQRIMKHGVRCWLVNTGWTGGAYGVGHRMPIKATRALLNAALDGSLNDSKFRRDPNFGFEVPESAPGVSADLLDPRQTWDDPQAYDAQARRLVSMFAENFATYTDEADEAVKAVAIG